MYTSGPSAAGGSGVEPSTSTPRPVESQPGSGPGSGDPSDLPSPLALTPTQQQLLDAPPFVFDPAKLPRLYVVGADHMCMQMLMKPQWLGSINRTDCAGVAISRDTWTVSELHAMVLNPHTWLCPQVSHHVDDADLPRFYAAVDAFVLPSRGEGWGRPHVEVSEGQHEYVCTRRYPNVWGFECLGGMVLGCLKHLIFTVLGAGQTL
jgi:hypothetical protein